MTTTSITTAVVIDQFGGPEVLRVAELPLGEPGSDQVRVEVAAVAINPVDLTTRVGKNIPVAEARFPMVLGWDVAGTVTEVGAGVTAWRAGDRVAAMVFQPVDQRGVCAAHLNLDAGLLARVPAGLALTRAATVPLAGLTASQLLDAVSAADPRSLLVDGPLGAVGRALVALAVRAGIEVIGVTRPEQSDDLLALGATYSVPRGDFADAVRGHHPGGVDAAVDLVGGPTSHATLASVRGGGRYATAVPPYIDGSGAFDDERGIAIHVHTVASDPVRLAELLDLAADGTVPTPVQATFGLDRADDAHRLVAAGGLTGRVVLVP